MLGASPQPSPSPSDGAAEPLRAPRYAPDGQALAFVDSTGSVGILELPAERLTLAPFVAAAAPIWLPDSSGVVLTGSDGTGSRARANVRRRRSCRSSSGAGDSVHRLARSGIEAVELRFGPGSEALGVGPDGSIAYADPAGLLRIAESASAGPAGAALTDDPVADAAIAPGEPTAVVVFAGSGGRRLGRARRPRRAVRGRRSRRTVRAHAGSRDKIGAPSLAAYVTMSSRRRFVCVNPRL